MVTDRSREQAAVSTYGSHFCYHAFASGYLYLACLGVLRGTIGPGSASIGICLGAASLFLFDLMPPPWLSRVRYRDYPALIVWPIYLATTIAALAVWLPPLGGFVAAVSTMALMSPSHRVGIGILEANFAEQSHETISIHSFWGLTGFVIAAAGMTLVLETMESNRVLASLLVPIGVPVALAAIRKTSRPRVKPKRAEAEAREIPAQVAPLRVRSVGAAILLHVFCGEFLFWFSQCMIFSALFQMLIEHHIFVAGFAASAASALILLGLGLSLRFSSRLMRTDIQMACAGGVVVAALSAMFVAGTNMLLLSIAAFLVVRIVLLDRQNMIVDRIPGERFLLALRLATMSATAAGSLVAMYLLNSYGRATAVVFLMALLLLTAQLVMSMPYGTSSKALTSAQSTLD